MITFTEDPILLKSENMIGISLEKLTEPGKMIDEAVYNPQEATSLYQVIHNQNR